MEYFFSLIEDYGELNEVKYIISAEWWRTWLEYVGFQDLNT